MLVQVLLLINVCSSAVGSPMNLVQVAQYRRYNMAYNQPTKPTHRESMSSTSDLVTKACGLCASYFIHAIFCTAGDVIDISVYI